MGKTTRYATDRIHMLPCSECSGDECLIDIGRDVVGQIQEAWVKCTDCGYCVTCDNGEAEMLGMSVRAGAVYFWNKERRRGG
jgi:uncharacterized Zn finger protein